MDLMGKAIAAVSLGLEVCNGVVLYCRSVKGRDKDIDHIALQIEALKSTFEALDSVIPRVALLPSSDQTAVASALECLIGCEDEIMQLKGALVSTSDTSGVHNNKGEVTETDPKLPVGLCQEEIASLLQKVQALSSTAGNALRALNLGLGLNHGENLAVLSTEEMNNRINALGTLVTAQNERTRDHFASKEFPRVSGNRLLGTPAVLREACDIVSAPTAKGLGTGMSGWQEKALVRCDCNLREKTTAMTGRCTYIGGMELSKSHHEASWHLPGCPLYTKLQSQRRVGVKFQIRTWSRFSILVRAGLSLTAGSTTGAGGLSISPQLNIRRVVRSLPAKSELCTALRIYADGKKPSDDESRETVEVARRNILTMFRDGKASPYDRLSHGSNLLFLTVEIATYWIPAYYLNPRAMNHLLRLVKMLAGAGVPGDEVDDVGSTPIDMLIQERPVDRSYSSARGELAHELASLSGDVPIPRRGANEPLQILELLMDGPALRHDLGLSPLAVAVLDRSEDDLRSILLTHPHYIEHRTYGMTVLHLSSRWPAGLSILLSAGAMGLVNEECKGMTLFWGNRAVDFALYFNCAEAVSLLFDAGCTWDMFYYFTIVDAECLQTVARHLAGRRRDLMRLAEDSLTETPLSAVGHRAGVIDSDAAAVVRLLRNAGVEVPNTLAVPDTYATVYLSCNLYVSYFPIFFDHGFHDIGPPADGWPLPIQVSNLQFVSPWGHIIDRSAPPGLFQWLGEHGFLDVPAAELLPSKTNTSTTGSHILAARVAFDQSFTWPSPKTSIPNNQIHSRSFYMDIFSSLESDGCRCACSSAGCVPLTTGLKTTIEEGVTGYCDEFHVGPPFERFLGETVKDDVASELLRFMTFEALEMAHTCCRATLKDPPKPHVGSYQQVHTLREFRGNIEEIHSEEEELRGRLEALVQEFCGKPAESGQGLRKFIRGYWRDRISDECVPRGKKDGVVADNPDVNLHDQYETPKRLQTLLGGAFTLQDKSFSEKARLVDDMV